MKREGKEVDDGDLQTPSFWPMGLHLSEAPPSFTPLLQEATSFYLIDVDNLDAYMI
jgi:hypothetical protein